jgi:hypothetical protein
MTWLWLVPALLLALTCVPLGLDLEVNSVPRFRGLVRVTWGGLVHTHVDIGAGGTGTRARRPRQHSERSVSPSRRPGLPPISALVPAIRHFAQLVRALLAQTLVRELTLRARAGLDDPADTGMLWGALAPLLAWAGDQRGSFDLAPEFAGSCLEVRGYGRFTLVPARYLLVLTAFLLNPRTWRLGYALRPS